MASVEAVEEEEDLEEKKASEAHQVRNSSSIFMKGRSE